jgi:hypothetical protein
MNALVYGNSSLSVLGRSNATSILKSSGSQTPAPASKVLRWKDLEAAAIEERQVAAQELSARSLSGTEELQDVLTRDVSWFKEGDALEELFV